ncbi:MAG: hypothetical protein ACYC1I_05805 [Acidimicrobiales bacterium]
MFAEWWREQFKEAMSLTGVVTIVRGDGSVTEFESIPFNDKIGGFCEVCNSGWMNNMEKRVRPFLLRMARDDLATRLTPAMQLALTNWAVKTVLVFDHQDPGNRVVPDTEYAAFYANKMPLGTHLVWIGRTDPGLKLDDPTQLRYPVSAQKTGIGPEIRVARTAAIDYSVSLSVNESPKMYSTTISLGYVVLQVVGTDLPVGIRPVEPIDFSDTLIPIWPVNSDVAWPPTKTVDNITGLNRLNDRWVKPSS